MSLTKNASQGAVASIADTDLVMCHVGGSYHPISFANLKSIIIDSLGLTKSTYINLKVGDWVRVAKGPSSATGFGGILQITHRYDNPLPIAEMITVSGCGTQALSMNAGSVLPNISTKSFSAVRFVNENSICYIEIKFAKSSTTRIDISLCGALNFSLVEATVSTAASANVLKTIEFSGGV